MRPELATLGIQADAEHPIPAGEEALEQFREGAIEPGFARNPGGEPGAVGIREKEGVILDPTCRAGQGTVRGHLGRPRSEGAALRRQG